MESEQSPSVDEVQCCGLLDLLDFVFLSEEFLMSCEEWNGQVRECACLYMWMSHDMLQVLSLTAGNYGVGYSALVLSQLPYLYENCSDQHLRGVADMILTSLALPDPTEGQGVELRDVVEGFLQSESFLEMRRLHETLFSQCLSAVKGKRWVWLPGCGCGCDYLTVV